jgi:DHA1 family bicyclomycin/chloramphenicol resistance-like MFS transporter
MQSPFAPQNKKEFVLLVMILGAIIALGPLTIDIYLPAFSAIAKDFQAPDSLVQLSLTTYFIGLAFGQIFYGPIIDRYGKKKPLFLGLILFLAATIACSHATNINQIIVLRFFQAFGACSCTVIPRSIVRDIFSPQESARVFSHLLLVMGIAPIMAPLIGNILLEISGWRAIFTFLAFTAILCLVLSHLKIPETKGFNENEKISDGLKKYLGILRDKNFVISSLIGGFAMAGLFSYITGSPFLYIEFFGLSSRHYGYIFSINSIGFIAASQINAKLLKKFELHILLKKVLILPAIAGVCLVFLAPFFNGFWFVTALFFITLCCCGMIMPNTSALAMANQAKHSGSASALLGTIQFILATITSFAISKFHNGSITPIVIVTGLCGVAPFLIYKYFFAKLYHESNS